MSVGTHLRRGPTGTILNDLAEQSFDRTNCEIIFVSPPHLASSYDLINLVLDGRREQVTICQRTKVSCFVFLQAVLVLRLGYPPEKWRNVYKVRVLALRRLLWKPTVAGDQRRIMSRALSQRIHLPIKGFLRGFKFLTGPYRAGVFAQTRK
jgi:hypothetical protein